jgi:hypothetical protein
MHEYGHVILSINCWEQGLALIENNLWAERPISTEKWDEQVLRIGETVSHEKDGAAPHRRSTE